MKPFLILLPTLMLSGCLNTPVEKPTIILPDVESVPVEPNTNLPSSFPLKPEKWHESHQMIAHALGEVDGYAETNSKEAFLSAYDKGFRIFEADLQLTTDEHLVVRHNQLVLNGSTKIDLDSFLQGQAFGKYTNMTAEDLVDLLVEHEDAYLVTDSKDVEPEIIQEQFRQLLDLIEATGDTSLYDRVIVQIYFEEMYELIYDLYPFEHWIFTLYQIYDPDLEEIGDFCAENAIEVVTMPYTTVTKEKSDILHSYDLKVYAHTINEHVEVLYGKSSGVDGFYTDFLAPDDSDIPEIVTKS